MQRVLEDCKDHQAFKEVIAVSAPAHNMKAEIDLGRRAFAQHRLIS